MNFKKTRALAKLISFVYESNISKPTRGALQITDNDVLLNLNGTFRRLCIYTTGNIFIYNNLPDGFSIKMGSNIICINNFLLKNLKNNFKLFSFDGKLEISKVYIITLGGTKINLNIEDKNKLNLIENNETEFDDSTLLLIDDVFEINKYAVKKGIDDDSIKGLFAHKPLFDGYTGFYNYHPKEKIFMTGKKLTLQSKPIGKKETFTKNKLNLSKIYNKQIQKAESKPVESQIKQVEQKPLSINSKKKQKKQIKDTAKTRGGSY
tara:strand:+ start:5306 stop:6097 length:792 start_codon:yes stop_codon:yes gene_type:complete